ncbi:MAG: hypothetical protein ACI80S_002063 [Pseudohongiellaceae bacterium]|jgi:uncharacterized protein (DUF934 family)
MTQIILDKQIANDDWTLVADDVALSNTKEVINFSRWAAAEGADREALIIKRDTASLGIQLNAGDTADLLAADSQGFALINVDFPKFADGRGYSAARLLRERYEFTGELRAVGDVLFDQLFSMMRCGFNAMAMRADQDLALAVKGFETFSSPYQGDVNDTRPLFRRRS